MAKQTTKGIVLFALGIVLMLVGAVLIKQSFNVECDSDVPQDAETDPMLTALFKLLCVIQDPKSMIYSLMGSVALLSGTTFIINGFKDIILGVVQ